MTAVPTLTLNNGVEIPQLGFGVFLVPPESTVETLSHAIEIGYRHIDTAQMYGNEKEVGQGIRDSGTDRGEVTFELPGMSEDEIVAHLEPLIARNCAGYSDPSAD